jgi:NAD+ kinase
MSSFKTVGVIGKRRDPRAAATVAQVCALLHTLGREVLVEADTAATLPPGDFESTDRAGLAQRCQLVVVIGGDGTLLDAGRNLAVAGVPILGVNQGRLGFLVDVRPEEMHETLDSVFRGEGIIDERPLLEARIHWPDGGISAPLLAVNDVVIRNQATIRMLEFETWLDDEFISAHRADGIIVSTPTGSTAYALSGGGPVMHPSLDAIALVPICPHTLSDRPIVVGAGKPICIVLRGEVAGATVTCDGQINLGLASEDVIKVTRSAHSLRLIHPRRYSYFDLLRNKLQWGRGPANLNSGS